MTTAIIIIHVLACVALVLVVLLQAGKGASMGAAFGGSSQTVFGSAGATTFLAKMTTVVALVFMLTSLGLAIFSGKGTPSSVMDAATSSPPAQTAPAPQQTAPAPVPVPAQCAK
jgi:preprotein translocase subunit SecG